MAFLALCGRELVLTARFANMSVVAAILEKDGNVADKVLTRVVNDAGEIRSGRTCRTDLVSAATTVLLHDMDRNSPDIDFDAWSAAVRRTEGHLLYAARCMPADSNVWLRYAALRSVVAENPEEVAALMHLSRRLAPADNHMLMARLAFWNSFSDKTLERAAPDVTGDIATLLAWGDRCAVVKALGRAEPTLAPYIEKARKQVPAERLKRLELLCPRENIIKGPFV
jgi:hypothetical protein